MCNTVHVWKSWNFTFDDSERPLEQNVVFHGESPEAVKTSRDRKIEKKSVSKTRGMRLFPQWLLRFLPPGMLLSPNSLKDSHYPSVPYLQLRSSPNIIQTGKGWNTLCTPKSKLGTKDSMVGCLPGTCKTPEKPAVLPSNKEKTKLDTNPITVSIF